MSNSHTKFGGISTNGLGGDSVTDGQMDRFCRDEAHVCIEVSDKYVLLNMSFYLLQSKAFVEGVVGVTHCCH